MMCERAGEVTAQTSSKYLPLGAIFRAYSKVRGYLLYPSKQLYNPQHTPVAHSLCHHCNTGGTTCPLSCFSSHVLPWDLRLLNFCHTHYQVT